MPIHRRTILAGLGLGAASLMPAPTTGATRADIDSGVAGLTARWDAISPVDVLADTNHWAYLCRTLPGPRPSRDWQATTGRVQLLAARAHAGLGETDLAQTYGQQARIAARAAGDTVTQAEADLVLAESHEIVHPGAAVSLQLARTARRRAGATWVGVHAAVTEALFLARSGPSAAPDVIDALSDAATVARLLPPPEPGQFTGGQLAAFGGCALARTGKVADAETWLAGTDYDPARSPGMASAVLTYRAAACVADRRYDEGAELAGRALDVSVRRPVAWLATGIRRQSARCGGAGGYDALVGRLGGWPQI